jgi:hypothetical protein
MIICVLLHNDAIYIQITVVMELVTSLADVSDAVLLHHKM